MWWRCGFECGDDVDLDVVEPWRWRWCGFADGGGVEVVYLVVELVEELVAASGIGYGGGLGGVDLVVDLPPPDFFFLTPDSL
ncbi:hypothetical protein Ddye_016939 [Dipteronia dyeriana]|uniref:Uncharacterized protein n=1 Tax=Dipteronia dyeriana TaxID=168575 RepID=A0AAD9U8M2_9ROSI|nr:hypothetical protein Ddye_016939 [Dipteronia dyeriana]